MKRRRGAPGRGLVDLKDIKLVIFDVDGVLTDGALYVSDEGVETKRFNVRDWTGLVYLERAGIRVAIVSGRASKAVETRAADVGITALRLGAKKKLPATLDVIRELGFTPAETAYLGDDTLDIPPALVVGYPAAVADAHEEYKSRCRHVTARRGGDGAAREFAEMIIKAQGKWPLIMKRYLDPDEAS